MEKKKITFVAHWVEPWNWLLWFLPGLHKHPEHRWFWIWLAPLYWAMSLVYLFGRKTHDTVDVFNFNGCLEGRTILIRNFAWHFSWTNVYEKIRERILEAILEAQKTSNVIGLGALTKAEWLTSGGALILERLGDKLTVPIVHGDTLTAAVIIEQALGVVRKKNIQSVFLTGSTSKIGRAVALALACQGVQVKMYTQDKKRFEAIRKEAVGFENNLVWATSLKDGSVCQLWITGKAIPKGKAILPFISKESTVLNFSVPNPLNPKLLRKRPDLKAFESGLLAYDPERTNLRFTMRLKPGITYACHAGTMVHAFMDWKHHEVGPVEMDQLPVVWTAAQELGFKLPPEELIAVSSSRRR